MRFRQRGKLSLHRRKHKGYKMKEYTLIGKNKEFSDGFSETETLLDKSHQDLEFSNNEASELTEKHIIPTNTKKATNSRRKRKTREESSDTDSEFEIPTYTTKKCTQKKSIRKRKASMKKKLNEDSMISSQESEPAMNDEAIILNSGPEVSYEVPNSNLLTVPTQKPRKESYDSTLDGSHCGLKHSLNTSKGRSAFQEKSLSSQKTNPNFETLVKAFKICQNLSNQHSDSSKKCEETKISNLHYPKPVYASDDNHMDLNASARFLNLSLLDQLKNGLDVNNYFCHLREQFNF